MASAIAMLHTVDPKRDLLDMDVAGFSVLGAGVLLGVYKRPEKTASGLYLSSKTQDEDKHQGKVGLVLKMGPIAFVTDDTHDFGTVIPAVGDWVLFNVGDTFGFELGERRCRIVEDIHIKAILEKPDGVL